ncbi:tyrosine-protein kinase Fer [Sabethes cyaneus]|uniref:tyrosine-protein kinase Fer n=1 Tax=Sabethes cyaneus TaxID=53552 RepID=UPI00237D649E|nr:tyrosine-protein kinase Fer [Sabethes cyaneus]
MVTTIKITCDGVFIQSNSYLTNGHHHHIRQQSAPVVVQGGSKTAGLVDGDQGNSASSSSPGSSNSDKEDSQMYRFNHNGIGVDRDDNNNRDLNRRGKLSLDHSVGSSSFQKNARRRYQSEEVLSRYQRIDENSDGSDTVDAAGPNYYNSGPVSDDQFTISFLNTRGQNGKSLLNQKFIVYNSKKPKASTILQNGLHPSQYRQFLNGRLKPAFSTSVLSSPSLIAGTGTTGAGTSGGRLSATTPPPSNGLTVAKSTSYLQRTVSPGPSSSSASSLSPSSGFASVSPTPLAATGTVGASSGANFDVDVRSESRVDRRGFANHQQQQQQQQQQQHQHHQQAHSTLSRRNSTGSSVLNGGMNSHTAAINLQSSGQTAVVTHHRGFSSTVVAAANSAASGDCPWFMPHQMPPTAPARQHKRPAPQPGTGGVPAGGVGVGGVGLMQPPQFINPPPAPQQQNQQQSQHSPQQHQQMAPPQLPPHSVTSNQNHSSIHLQQQQQQQQVQHHQQPPPLHAGSMVPPAHHIPKSPNQHNMLGPSSLQQQQQQQQQQGQQLHQQPVQHNAIGSHQSNLMSASMNSAQLQNHILSSQPSPASLSAIPPHSVQQQQQQQQQSQPPPSHGMSNSMHAQIGLPPPPTGGFDSNGVPNSWNSAGPAVASLSPTAAASAQRRAEVNAKLNAMPWFHGRIKREEAENLLKPREDGLFLVRESTNFPGDYTLCVCFNEKVEHYRIKYAENKLTIDDDEYFDNLGQLVEHYTLDSDGLCTKLMKALPKEEFCVKDFQDNGWEIKMEDLQLKENIGKGEFGDVMLGILKGEKVAVKVLKDAGRASNKFLAEAGVMTTLQHENLVKFIGLVFHDKYIYLVTEFMSKGSLVDYLRSRGRQHITRKDQINFAFDTCSGMEYLETKKVIHRDLAARNVLISEECVAKVSDFGLARDERYTADISKLPIKWTAPEALKEGKFSNKTDMWSFGILLWEIYSFGRVPYPRIPLADVVKHVGSGYKMEAPEGCPPEIYEMMRQAWDLVPEKRPTFAELKRRLAVCKRETANTYVT